MASRPRVFRATAQPSRAEQNREADMRRGSARKRGYTTAWDKASAGHVRNNPLCRYCDLAGQVRPSELTDHLYPHKGDQDLFWNKRYWIASCTECHAGFKQRTERRGRSAIDALAIRLGLDPI